MGYINARLRRLEERWRVKPLSHHVSVVRYPWDLPDGDRDRWLAEEVECACGVVGCERMTIGLVSPEKAPSAEAWSAQVQAYYREREAHA